MLAEDIAPNRLTRAKLAALDLMQQAKSDRLGLVAFAGGAFLQCPLTIDDNAFRQSVEALDVNIIPQGGTAVAEAITTALTAFKEGDNFKVLVLFTDGEDNDENALAAAAGGREGGHEDFHHRHRHGGGRIAAGEGCQGPDGLHPRRRRQRREVTLERSACSSRSPARRTAGFYLPLRGAKTIDTLYEKGLAPLPKSEGQEKLVKRFHERYHWPLGLAILLLLVEMLMPERKRAKARTASRKPPTSQRAGDRRRSAGGLRASCPPSAVPRPPAH